VPESVPPVEEDPTFFRGFLRVLGAGRERFVRFGGGWGFFNGVGVVCSGPLRVLGVLGCGSTPLVAGGRNNLPGEWGVG
jgi:hypothetical protein